MIQIKIYDKTYTPLTAFNIGEFGALNYKKTLGQIGDASFTLDISSAKVTDANMRNYNRIEILDAGVVQWTGYIVSKNVTLNIVTIQCKELAGILAKRLTADAYVLSGVAGTLVGTLLTAINGVENTGITMGVTDVVATINLTFNQQDAFSVLKDIADAVGAQFVVNTDRTLDFMMNVGVDHSADVRFEYNILQPQQANLIKFNVEDNGENIVTRSRGANSTLSSTQNDAGLQALYGIIEKFGSFPQANNQTNLDALTASALQDTLYSPALDLSPGEDDDFNIGDLVAVFVKNKLVDIDDTFQVLEKSVKIVNSQKSISVKINQLPQTIVNSIKDLQRQVNLLETN